jgi:hypothetical protein
MISINFGGICNSKQVFTIMMSAQQRDTLTGLVQIRTSQKLFLSLGSSAWLIKQAVQLQRTITLEATLIEKHREVMKILLNEAATELIARSRIEQLETAMSEFQNKSVGNTGNIERENQNRSNALETFQKQLTAARNEYNRIIEPWRDAVRQDGDLQRKITAITKAKQQISGFGCDCLDIERPLGIFLKPSEWKILNSDGG